ncbi:GlsB/YeaQ/YmgE family stress response membrane protein [Chitinimonas viridis]|uniref:GlsB/YeaQ/YmgE family stress response membrane protein n=1 Tax=Chitinimonas viridis TaxID=664880 RepID=A0ABT8B1B7_9NEIS|nr:GlsB/YeaQ/YmgE family stress response membrane protein [Chitinimonas viridis]MDN3575510.1 GlsB/YeaQ/YmgE family stress response membrane protein [Chitinimonas viridis]
MSFFAWLLLGLIAGLTASKILNRSGQGLVLDIVLGMLGAIIGGSLFTAFGLSGITGLNLYSILVAVVGASLLLMIYHGIARASQ